MEANKEVLLITTQQGMEDFLMKTVFDLANRLNLPEWIPAKHAAELLGIKEATLRDWRIDGKIDFTQSSTQVYLYSRTWINEHLKKNAKKAFK